MVAAVRPADAVSLHGSRWSAWRVRVAAAAATGRRTRGSAVLDGLVVLVMLASAGATYGSQTEAWSHLPSWWPPVDVGVGVVAAVALWWRRSHPLLVAAVLGVLGGVFIAAGFPALVALYTLASLRPLWIPVLLTLLHLGIAIPYYLWVPIGDMGLLGWSVLMTLLYTSCLAIGAAVRARRQTIVGLLEAAEAERAEHERRLSSARDAERSRIAREMHDVLAHRLSILSVHAGALEHRSREGGDRTLTAAQTREAAGVIRRSAHTALEELRQVLHLLGAATGDEGELGRAAPQPTAADLPRLLEEAAGTGQRVDLVLDPELATRLGEARAPLQRTLYRVVQEGLTNARKHAPGAAVRIAVTDDPGDADVVRVTVTNRLPVGVAPTEVPGSRAGLTGLAERVELDGGRLTTEISDGELALTARLRWQA